MVYGSLPPMRAMWAFLATALVLGSCARQDWIDRTLVTTDVSGVWTGSIVSLDGQPMISSDVRLELQQKATKVTGSLQSSNAILGAMGRGSSFPINGSVTTDVFTFTDARTSMTGELTVDGDEMKGEHHASTSRGGCAHRFATAVVVPK